jgi:hypothetical protein
VTGEDQDATVADSVVRVVTQAGGASVSSPHSVADAGGAEQMVQTALETFGRRGHHA